MPPTRQQIIQRLLSRLMRNEWRDVLWVLVYDEFDVTFSRQTECLCVTFDDLIENIKLEMTPVGEDDG